MAFETYETSVDEGQPVELYVFDYDGGTYRHTSDAEDIIVTGVTYTAIPGLSRSAIEDSGEISKSSLTLTAPEDYMIARLFEVVPPSSVVELSVKRVHRSDLTDVKTMWLGRVLNASWSVGYSTLMCESFQTRLKQPGLRRIYSKNCPHVLYGNECKADPLLHFVTRTVTAITEGGFLLETAPFGMTALDAVFSGGKIEFDAGGGITERRGIRDAGAAGIRISHPIPSLDVGESINIFKGCDRTRDTCIGQFNNLDNYGGFPYMKDKNPFGQSSVF